MAIIVTVNAGSPLIGTKYQIAGTISNRKDLAAAVASELGFHPSSVTVQAPNVFVDGRAYATLTEGFVDKPANRKISTFIRRTIQTHVGDRDTLAMMALKSCIRHVKHTCGMSKSQVISLVESLYDAAVDTDD